MAAMIIGSRLRQIVFDGALEIVFYGTAIKLYGNLEPMGGISASSSMVRNS